MEYTIPKYSEARFYHHTKQLMSFSIETISDDSNVYRTFEAEKSFDGKYIPRPLYFDLSSHDMSSDPAYLSVNWKKYCKTPQQAQKCRGWKPPERYGVLELAVQDIKNIDLDVLHVPSKKDRSHSWIFTFGTNNNTEVQHAMMRKKMVLARISKCVLEPSV